MSFEFPHAAGVLGAMITPAVLISASGTLVLSTTNRLARIVDRVRKLYEEADGLRTPDGLSEDDRKEKAAWISEQLGWQVRRIRMLQSAVTVLYAAIGMLVGSSLAVGLSAAANWAFSYVPVLFGLAGASALFYVSLVLVREARMAVKATLLDMAHVRKIVARRTGVAEPDEND